MNYPQFLSILLLTMTISIVVQAEEQIIFGVTETWHPHTYIEKGKITGQATRIVEATLQEAGFNYSLSINPWARSYKLAQTNQNTLIFSIARTPQRENMFKWVGKVARRENRYLIRLNHRSDIQVTHLEDAKKYKIGVVRHSMDDDFLINHNFDNLTRNNQHVRILKQLFSGRIDLAIAGENDLKPALNLLNKEESDIHKVLLLHSSNAYMAFSLTTPDAIVREVRSAYEKLIKQGKIPEY